MTTDRELLELAAKAVDIEYDDFDEDQGCDIWFLPDSCRYAPWNPLTDDGDALRLAVKLGLVIAHLGSRAVAARNDCVDQIEPHSADPLAATRRAIVRAAAEIGRSMP